MAKARARASRAGEDVVETRTCNYCHMPGHFVARCKKKAKDEKKGVYAERRRAAAIQGGALGSSAASLASQETVLVPDASLPSTVSSFGAQSIAAIGDSCGSSTLGATGVAVEAVGGPSKRIAATASYSFVASAGRQSSSIPRWWTLAIYRR